MSSPTSAQLSGPTFGQCGIASADFTVTLDHPAGGGGVVVTVLSTIGGDTITSSPFTIAAGDSSGTFKITPSSGGNRDISISTVPTLIYINSPWTYMAKAPLMALQAPVAPADCSFASGNWQVNLAAPACGGGIVITVTSSESGDVITPSTFTIAAGSMTGGPFTVTPNTCGNRTITISSNPPAMSIIGSPRSFGSNCACPDDAGTANRFQSWGVVSLTCPEAFSLTNRMTPSTIWAKDFYCGTVALDVTTTE